MSCLIAMTTIRALMEASIDGSNLHGMVEFSFQTKPPVVSE